MDTNTRVPAPLPSLLVGVGGLFLFFYLFTGLSLLPAIGAVVIFGGVMAMVAAGRWRFDIQGVPAPYSYLAGILGGLLLLAGLVTPMYYGELAWGAPTGTGGALLGLLNLVAIVGYAAAPWVAVRRFWLALLMAVGLPAILAAISTAGSFPALSLVSLLGAGVCATWRRPRAPWVAALVAMVPVALIIWLPTGALIAPGGSENRFDFHRDPEYLSFTTALFAVAFAVAAVLGPVFRRFVTEREAGRQALARAGEVEERSAVVEERARLARDLHDVVAHHVSLIAVRAETAPYTHADLGPAARTVLADIAADARLALDELRGVLGILGRAGEDPGRAPQPSWNDIAALVERTRAAGLEVSFEGDTGATVPPTAGYAAYRVVQEGLTNARKHAPGAPVSVVLSATDRLVHVSMRNPVAATPAGTGGRGLVGMKERVSALGGRMTAGPVAGEYVVEVTLPVVSS